MAGPYRSPLDERDRHPSVTGCLSDQLPSCRIVASRRHRAARGGCRSAALGRSTAPCEDARSATSPADEPIPAARFAAPTARRSTAPTAPDALYHRPRCAAPPSPMCCADRPAIRCARRRAAGLAVRSTGRCAVPRGPPRGAPSYGRKCGPVVNLLSACGLARLLPRPGRSRRPRGCHMCARPAGPESAGHGRSPVRPPPYPPQGRSCVAERIRSAAAPRRRCSPGWRYAWRTISLRRVQVTAPARRTRLHLSDPRDPSLDRHRFPPLIRQQGG
jgi:hypothetical protein